MNDFFDWPRLLWPEQLKIRQAASRIDGSLTRAGVGYSSPDPGGRWVIDLSLPRWGYADYGRLFGWLLDELEAGSVFRMTVWNHAEAIKAVDLGYTGTQRSIPYNAYGGKSYHSDGSGFAFIPTARSVGAALEGEISMQIDVGSYDRSLKPGHLIGHQHQINRIRSITWEGSVATVGLRMPLRADIPDDAIIRLQKMKFLVQADRQSIQSFRGRHEAADIVAPGQITLMEYLF